MKGRTSTDLISTRDLSTGHRFNHVGHHRDGNEEASHVVKHLLSGSLQSFSFNLFGFSFLSFWSDRVNTRAGVDVCGFSKARHMRSRNVSRIMSPGDI